MKKVERWEAAHRKPPELEPLPATDIANAYSTPTRQRGILGRGSATTSDRGPRSGRDSANSRRRMIVRSDYEQQKILSEIMESEKQRYKFVKNKALIPPMLLSSRDRFVHQRVGFWISSNSTHFGIVNIN